MVTIGIAVSPWLWLIAIFPTVGNVGGLIFPLLAAGAVGYGLWAAFAIGALGYGASFVAGVKLGRATDASPDPVTSTVSPPERTG